MAEKKNVPEIRFSVFSEAWRGTKLDHFVSFFSGLTYTPEDVQTDGTLVLRSSNVKDGEVVDADNVYVNPLVVNCDNVKKGDIIVVVRNGSRALIGKHAEIKKPMPNTVIGAFMTGIRSESSEFLNALLDTPYFEKEVEMNMGATINQITGYMFSKMVFNVPKLPEQIALGSLFQRLDNIIALQQQKLEKLQNVKKSMLEKMFPQDGKDVPEIRFKGFKSGWKEYRVSDIANRFDKVAALFDQSIDNNGKGIFKEDGIVEMLEDYNRRYGQKYSIPSYAMYKKDVSLRLAHKKPYVGIERDPSKQVDLLIVVDQMLTGFDSKWINTLYLDKILKYERLIQAFSRTNRLFGPDKPFGMIRYYRWPHTMAQNIEEAFKLYSGEKPLGLFADKLEKNLTKMNQFFDDIADLFKAAGVEDFQSLPKDIPAKARFAKLFKTFNNYLEAALVQGFSWEKEEYIFQNAGDEETVVSMHLDERVYLILVLRYKELFSPHIITESEDLPYEIEPHLTEINTGAIDRDYMNTRFNKYLKALQNGEKTADVLNELHKSFAMMTKEEQKHAHMFLLDVQRGDVVVEKSKSLSDYIVEYQDKDRSDRIHRFATAIGVDETQLHDFMNRHITEDNINDYGLFDRLKETVDRNTAQQYFENLEGKPIKPFRVPSKVDRALRRFIIGGGSAEEN